VQHDIALIGERNVDLDRLARDLALVCQKHIDLFGGPAPFERYLYLINAVAEGQGGLEHRSSTTLLCRRNSLPTATMTQPNDDYVALLGLASHEYFHAWNVKRIKPAAFVTYDLSREAYTRQLWVFEGITSYYDDLALVRCGAITTAQYLEVIGRAITSLLRTPGRNVQSIADASFDAWIKYYRQDESTPNVGISYYLKGSLVALTLDLTLRAQGRTSLDAVTRMLWQRYGRRESAYRKMESTPSRTSSRAPISTIFLRALSTAQKIRRLPSFYKAAALHSTSARRSAPSIAAASRRQMGGPFAARWARN
jgi:predicted metalloprotease with PDZ domain